MHTRNSFLVGALLALLAAPTAAQIPSGYYDTVDTSSAGALRSTLHAVIDDHLRFPYTDTSTDTWNILELADEDPCNAANILDVYKNESYPKAGGGNPNYDREHTWPSSFGFPTDGGANYPFTDCHQLRLADSGYNSARSNKPYRYCPGCLIEPTESNCGEGGGSAAYPGTSNWTGGSTSTGSWETWADRRGDVARSLLYLDVRYEGGTHGVTAASEPDLILTDDQGLISASNTGQNEPVAYMGVLSDILQWHLEDPVDAKELARNDVVYGFQGNRNPFVDHPEWVALVFNGTPELLSADVTSVELTSGGTQTLSLEGGAGLAFQLYWILGSATGTAPGLPPLPLNFDGYFLFTLQSPNTLIQNSLSFLDGNGSSTATITFPPGTDPSLAGVVLNHAYAVIGLPAGDTLAVSNPVSLELQVTVVVDSLVINEVDYDQPSTDTTEYIEIYNPGPDPVDLSGVVLELFTGSDGSMYGSYALSTAGSSLAAGQYLVLGSATVLATVPLGVLKVPFDFASNNVQNGAPDGIVLRSGATVLDSMSYEGTMVGITEGLGGAGLDDPSGAQSLSRIRNGVDTDDNTADFQATATLTPGSANVPNP